MKWWIGPLAVTCAGCCAWAGLLTSSPVVWKEVVVKPAPKHQIESSPAPTPAIKKVARTPRPAQPKIALTGCINVNSADMAKLDLLPGIGPALAQRIVESRSQDGPFVQPEDLTRVKGIGPARLDKIRDHICF